VLPCPIEDNIVAFSQIDDPHPLADLSNPTAGNAFVSMIFLRLFDKAATGIETLSQCSTSKGCVADLDQISQEVIVQFDGHQLAP
jgi:hypothetical protein